MQTAQIVTATLQHRLLGVELHPGNPWPEFWFSGHFAPSFLLVNFVMLVWLVVLFCSLTDKTAKQSV